MMDNFEKMMDFIARLESKNIWYRLAHNRDNAMNVEVYVPGAHWDCLLYTSPSPRD